MKTVPCYMVRVIITSELMGRSCLETYFVADSDRDAVMDSFRHARALVKTYSVEILKLQVIEGHLGEISEEGVPWGSWDRMLYDSDSVTDSIVKERPGFIR